MPKGKIELHTDVLSTWDALSDAEWGRLVKAMLTYRLTGQVEQLLGAERIMFPGERVKIDRQLEAEEKRKAGTRERVTRYRALQSVTERYTPSPSSPPSSSPPSSPPIPPVITPVSLSPILTSPPKEKGPPKGGPKKKAPMPPTLDDVSAYCLERENGIDPEAFMDFYIANGWTQGKGKPIVDWKAAVRTWEKNRKPSAKAIGSSGNSWMKKYIKQKGPNDGS